MRRVSPFDARAYYYYYGGAAGGSRRFGAVGGTFSPISLSPLVWLRVDDLALAEDAAIATFTDLSGNGNHFTQSTVDSRAINKTGIVNGHAVARFDGSDDYFDGPDFSALTAGEIFIVIKLDADPPASGKTGLWLFGEAGDITHFPFTDGVIYDQFGSTARKTTVDPAADLSAAFRLYNVVSVSGEWTSFLDGAQLFTTGTNTVDFRNISLLGQSDIGVALDGDVAEMVLFDRKLAAAEKTNLKTYFANRYAMSIA